MVKFIIAQLLEAPESLPKSEANAETVEAIISIVFGIFGALAFLIMVLAAFQFVVSAGDPQKTARARNAIVYAAIGLAVSAGAVLIVQFIFGGL